MNLRTGTILDLTAIARNVPAYILANELNISKGSISNYISSLRNIKKESLYDLASRWSNSVKPILSNHDTLIPKHYATIDEYLTELFISAYNSEMSTQDIINGESLEYGFSCCTAQVLSPWSEVLEFADFNSKDAQTLLRIFIKYHIDKLKPYNELDNVPKDDGYHKKILEDYIKSRESEKEPIKNEQGILQTVKYILWRIKTREGYYLDRVPPENNRKETQSIWPIPKIDPDISRNVLIQYLPARPSLKKPSVIDILMFCRGLSIGIELQSVGHNSEYKDVYSCSCYNLNGEKIKFLIHRKNW